MGLPANRSVPQAPLVRLAGSALYALTSSSTRWVN